MSVDPLHIFDPRRTMHVQGFSGRAATTTLHDATETGISISGIFQAAEDFAVLCLYNAYDYFSHLRLKHLPRTDLSGLKLEFEIECDHALDGAMRFDAPKFPSVSWDAITFVTGAGDLHEVKLLDHATAISGGETPATCRVDADGIWPDDGLDYLHLFFRDTRYTVSHADARVETQLANDVQGSADAQWIEILSVAGIGIGDRIYIELTGANEEATRVLDIQATPSPRIRCVATINHPADSYVTVETGARHLLKKIADIMNTPGQSVAGRYGPDQSGVISAAASRTGADGSASGALVLTFVTPALPIAHYGKLGNLDRILVTSGHSGPGAQGIDWTGDRPPRFSGGDDNTKYRITLDFTQPLFDKLGRTVPMNDCSKIYMVFAPRFERIEEELEDGCFLTADTAPGDTVLQVNDTANLTGGRYFIGNSSSEERLLLVSVDSATQITVQRGYQNSTPAFWPAGTRLKKLSPVTGVDADIEWRVTISSITVTGDRSLKVGGAAPRIEESHARCKYEGYWENYAYGAGWPTQWWSAGHAKRTTTGKVTIRYSHPGPHDLYLGTFLSAESGQISVSVDGDTATPHGLYLNEYGGTTACVPLRPGLVAGTHTVSIAASGGYFYFDYLWPLEPQDVPDPPQEYSDVSLAIDQKDRVTAGAALSGSDLPAHQHVASDVVSGALALARGGTGLLGAQRGDVATVRALWCMQDKIALTPEEEKAIELKREFIAGQERVTWNPDRSLAPKEFEFTDTEIARLKSALETWNGFAVNADRRWLQPVIAALFANEPQE